jgi:hypothetical protein
MNCEVSILFNVYYIVYYIENNTDSIYTVHDSWDLEILLVLVMHE